VSKVNDTKYLLAHYPLTGHTKDISGHGRDIEYYQGVNWANTNIAGFESPKFNGTDYFQVYSASWFRVQPPLSFTAYIENESFSGQKEIVNVWDYNVDQKAYRFNLENGKLQFKGSSNQTIATTSTSSLITGASHVGVTVNSSGVVKFYINGELTDTDTGSPTSYIYNQSQSLAIGATNLDTTPASAFDGYINNVRIYNTELTGSEMLEIARTDSKPKQPSVTSRLNSPTTSSFVTDSSLKVLYFSKDLNTFEDAINSGRQIPQTGSSLFIEANGSIIQDGSTTLERPFHKQASDVFKSGSFTVAFYGGSVFENARIFRMGDSNNGFEVRVTGSMYRTKLAYDGSPTTRWNLSSSVSSSAYVSEHVVTTFDSSSQKMKLFLDGKKVGEQNYSWQNAVIPSSSLDGLSFRFSNLSNMSNFRIYDEVKDEQWVKEDLKNFISGDSSLIFHTLGGTKDLSHRKYTLYNNEMISLGRKMVFNSGNCNIHTNRATGIYGSSSRTIFCWAKINTSITNHNLWSIGNSNPSSSFSLRLITNTSARVTTDGINVKNWTLPEDTNDTGWHNFCVTHNGNVNTLAGTDLYFDGVKIPFDDQQLNPFFTAGSQDLVIGALYNETDGNLTGEMFDIRVYKDHKNEGWVKREVFKSRKYI